jgi:hypothetical protein
LLSAALDASALAVLMVSPGDVNLLPAATMLHLMAVAAVWMHFDVDRSRMWLASALVLMLPLVGVAVAMLEQAIAGREEIAHFFTTDVAKAPPLTAEQVSRLTDSLSPSDALLSDNAEERRTTLAMLVRRADSETVGLLRWAVAGPNPELAVEAALALEDLSLQFEARAAGCRKAVEERPSFETALFAADTIAAGIHVGLADPMLVAPLAAEARKYYEQAARFTRDWWPEVAARWARLEEAALRPDRASEVLSRPHDAS